MTAVNGHALEPWAPPTDTEIRRVAETIHRAWYGAFDDSHEAHNARGALVHRLADLLRNYGRTGKAVRNEPCKTWDAWLLCPCGDSQRVRLTDEQVRRHNYEPLLGEIADVTYPVQVHAETCPRALRRPNRPVLPVCGVILGCVPCQLPAGHGGKHDPAPEPPVANDDPDWAIQTPTRKDI